MKNCVFDHFDECKALVEQVPDTFFFGTTLVGLTCFDVSRNYFAFGSNSGAIFVFNRKLNRSAAPLRTSYDAVITCISLFSGASDYLAAGHQSGSLVLIRFPSGSDSNRRKIEQTIEQGHRGQSISCVTWSEDGSRVISADESGVIVINKVDFDRSSFGEVFVYTEAAPVCCLSSSQNLIAVSTTEHVALYNVDSNVACTTITSDDPPLCDINGLGFDESSGNAELLAISRSMICFIIPVVSKNVKSIENLKEIEQRNINDVIHLPRCEKEHFVDLTGTEAGLHLNHLIVAGGKKLVFSDHDLIILSNHEELSVDYIQRIEGSKICDVKYDMYDEFPSIYVLTTDRRVFRFSSQPAPVYLTEFYGFPKESLFSSALKASKLLPYAPTGAIFNLLGQPLNEAMNRVQASNIPIAAVVGTTSKLMQSSSSLMPSDTSCPLNGAQSFEKDVSVDNQNVLKGNEEGESVARNINSVSQNSSNSMFDNVNLVTKRLLENVGGTGIRAESGVVPIHSTASDSSSLTSIDALPSEQFGVLEEVLVHRARKAHARRKKADDSVRDDLIDIASLGPDDTLNAVDSVTLNSIREALANPYTTSFASQKSDSENLMEPLDDLREGCIHTDLEEQSKKADSDVSSSHAACSDGSSNNESVPVVAVKGEEELGDIVSSDARAASLPNTEFPEPSELNDVFQKLMKSALDHKTDVFNTQSLEDSLETFVLDDFEENGVIVNDRGDSWNELKTPYSVSEFSVSSRYLVVCHAKKKKQPRYIPLDTIYKEQWIALKYDADIVQTNNSGNLLWRVLRGVATSPIETAPSSPVAKEWGIVVSEGGVVEVALTHNSAWYITTSGEVYVQLLLPEMGILSRCESAYPLRCIAASEVAVWTINAETGRLIVRVGLRHFPAGLDWVEVDPDGPTRLKSICLYDQSGLAIDQNHSFWFTNGISYQTPFGSTGTWLQIITPWDPSPELVPSSSCKWTIRVSSFGVFVCLGRNIFWAPSSCPISGHRFIRQISDKEVIADSFRMITAGSARDSRVGAVFLCRDSEIFMFRMERSSFYSLPIVPSSQNSSVKQIAASGNCLYVLDSCGCIHVRQGIGGISPLGEDWTILDTGDCGSPIVSVAVTLNSVWVLTANSTIYYSSKVGMSEECKLTPNWKNVRPPKTVSSVDQIRASSNGLYVWVFSSLTARLWARVGISDGRPMGFTWSEACGEPGICELVVGCSVVWSLSSCGQLLRLQGLASGNPTGNYWKPVPAHLNAISLDAGDHLWAIDTDNRLVRHKVEFYPPSFNKKHSSQKRSNSVDSSNTSSSFVLF